jgi:hypothetical protein
MKRTAVAMTDDERAEIAEAMAREGVRNMSDYLRIAALEKARKGKR